MSAVDGPLWDPETDDTLTSKPALVAVPERNPAEPRAVSTWLETGAALFSHEPQPVEWLVDQLITPEALVAIQGYAKSGKTWVLLEIARALVTGTSAFGYFAVPKPRPVMLVLEESPRRSSSRRISQLARGRAQGAEDLALLHVASNQRVRLNRLEWQVDIKHAIEEIRPALVLFDPLVRVKGDADENEQKELQPSLNWLSDLRKYGCAVGFAHHTGHAERGRMRGSSDLEAWWSSKIAVETKDKKQRLSAQHRDAEGFDPLDVRREWDALTETMRLQAVATTAKADDLHGRLLDHIRTQDDGQGFTKSALEKAMGGKAQTVRDAIQDLLGRSLIHTTGGRLRAVEHPLAGLVPDRDEPRSSPLWDDRDERNEEAHAHWLDGSSLSRDERSSDESSVPSPPIGGTGGTRDAMDDEVVRRVADAFGAIELREGEGS